MAQPVQLSVLMPTHRAGLGAVARIAQVCSWAGPDIEVIVRDNSGNAAKRDLISRFRSENCHIVLADPCEPLENMSEVLRLAKADFIFCPHDDDLCFDRAVQAVPDLIKQFGGDPSVSGIAGQVVVETSKNSAVTRYTDIDSDDVVARVNGYAGFGGPNILLYSVIRREMFQRIMLFMNDMPIFLSFHDQIQSLLFLLCGKFIPLPRLLYSYDMGVWGAAESAQRRDLDYCSAAGLDPALNTLHWFLCAFEGAALIRNGALFPDYPLAQRQPMADRWFAAMFHRFKNNPRLTFNSKYTAEAERLCAQLVKSTGQMSFDDMLRLISAFIALSSSQDEAQRYSSFWSAVIDRRNAAAALPRAAAG